VSLPVARGHGSFHELITAAQKSVDADPRNPDLYVRRGELYRAHGDLEAAVADYDRAVQVAPGFDVELLKARAYLEGGRVLLARGHAERAVSRYPQSAEARIIRGRILGAVGQKAAAAADFGAAFERTDSPSPELVLEVSRAQRKVGRPEQALATLEAGMKKLGRIVTLQLDAIELEVEQKRWDAALSRVDELSARSPRKETWLQRKGEILTRAGRRDDARQAFRDALAAIEALPAHLKGTPATGDLAAQLRASLGKVDRQAPRRARR